MVKVTVTTEGGQLASFDVDADAPVSNLRLLIEAELDIPAAAQELRYNGHKVKSSGGRTVGDAGIEEGGLLLVKLKTDASSTPASPTNSGSNSGKNGVVGTLAGMGRRVAQARPIRKRNNNNAANLPPSLLNGSQGSLMNKDQQTAIEEAIRRDNINKNFEAALEHNPESFGTVYMLYVDAKVNGNSVKAFVDTGAQTTIISKHCAQRCGIYRLLDRRFQGIARGIGVAKILGRIHMALLTVGTEVLECSFTVMDDRSIELLLGLDMLKKHQASVDLRRDCLRVHNSRIPFLSEKDIPKFFDGLFKGQEHPGMRPGHAMSAASPTASNLSAPSAVVAGPSNLTAAIPNGSGSSDPGKYSKSTIKRLTQLGFSKQQVVQALDACGGNEDYAANYLAQSKYGF
eukprot:Plantae.Rhodophyta-Hildenbrandia_rubra.ctg8700.p1 GENE.Plantae.Rhodophyta-Hildenbrandia_rubra.ctg8700~~Plantae.Rhodophyta-Hildenbrandia_rubra.ctg8700.p1  ORF type:complete len:401 (-),score=89.40 Plantae.Rhodophyta-Hildenbrandia_rubra.ctg8700:737-1939(-)